MKREPRTASPVHQPESPLRHLPLVDRLVDTKHDRVETIRRMKGLSVNRTPVMRPARRPHPAKHSAYVVPSTRRG